MGVSLGRDLPQGARCRVRGQIGRPGEQTGSSLYSLLFFLSFLSFFFATVSSLPCPYPCP